MWKPGQCVTLWGKVYRIHKCIYSYVFKPVDMSFGYKVCYFCMRVNIKPPCINAYYPENKGFDAHSCKQNIPNGCIPKLIKRCGNQDKL